MFQLGICMSLVRQGNGKHAKEPASSSNQALFRFVFVFGCVFMSGGNQADTWDKSSQGTCLQQRMLENALSCVEATPKQQDDMNAIRQRLEDGAVRCFFFMAHTCAGISPNTW